MNWYTGISQTYLASPRSSFAAPAPLGKPFLLPSAASPAAGLEALASSFPYLHAKCCQIPQTQSVPVPILPKPSTVKVVLSGEFPPPPARPTPLPALAWTTSPAPLGPGATPLPQPVNPFPAVPDHLCKQGRKPSCECSLTLHSTESHH